MEIIAGFIPQVERVAGNMLFLYDDPQQNNMSVIRDCQSWGIAEHRAMEENLILVGQLIKYVVVETGESIYLH